MTDPKIIVALDYPDATSARQMIAKLDPAMCRLKVGKELFTAEGPAFVASLVDQGYGVFLDLKFYDIPNTTAKACEAAARLGVWMLNVHASGGRAMMQAAREAVSKATKPPLLIAVTVLTSMDEYTLNEVGVEGKLEDQVLRLASLTQACGLDGVVCSAQEAPVLRNALGQDFHLVTPGIRPTDSSKDDQSRIVTPADAMRRGSSYLVIGRPITQSPDPRAALLQIQTEIRDFC
jgi:orotidine-5'-phosphate decarboxylase